MHSANSFLTLTYSDASLPDDYSVSVRAMQLFMKRLRKALGHRVRFFLCGEYGERNYRPHYHLIIFGFDFPDKKLWRKTPAGYLTYRSEFLETLWTDGHAEVGDVTVESAGYVARYVTKKINGERAEEHYRRPHPITGLICDCKPEFVLMSRRPGIGQSWFDAYSGDCFPSDFVVIEGKKRPIPRAYKKRLSDKEAERVTADRKRKSWRHADNNTPERLAVREEVAMHKTALLKRSMEEDS